MNRYRSMLSVVLIAALAGLALSGCGSRDRALTAAMKSITAEELAQHIKTLSADEFEGRGPSSAGEEKTIAFLQQQFAALGLRPGNGDDWLQEVPLVEITADPDTLLTVRGRNDTNVFGYGKEFIGWTTRVTRRSAIKASGMIFVGYGIVAPEYEWNDYEGIDARGKTVVMLVNDPGFATQDPDLFNGNAMTYYGRWTYKFEEAARQGAAGALIVHEIKPAAYPWAVVQGSWSGPQFGLVTEDKNMSRAAVEGWISIETTRTIFTQAGLDFEDLKKKAEQPGFKPVDMGVNASVAFRNRTRRSTSNNVLALLPGGARGGEYVIYMAHWDHLGRDDSLKDDKIYNGALDNASGIATLLELAEAFSSMETAPARSIVFMATTAEEQGLLGSAYYAANPIYPPERTVAAINMDGANIWGPMRDVTVIGHGFSELDDYVEEAARLQQRVVRPDPEPEKGYYFRSDHFTLAKRGIPALYTDAGIDHLEHGEEWSRAQRDAYTAERYHKPSDEFDPAWDLSGAVDDAQLLFRIGFRLANEATFPNWREGSEFRAARDAMLAGSP